MNIRKKWISISILSLAISGLYSIFIVLLRTPLFTNFFKDKSFFQTALIVHVDLSVLFWMVCFIMMYITNHIESKYESLVKILQNLLLVSIALICMAPFIGESQPYMNNYIPILHNLFFIIGIAIFITVYFIISCVGCISGGSENRAISILGVTVISSFTISAIKISSLSYPIDQFHFYEMLFWGGGHILQLVYCAGLIIAISEFSKEMKIGVSQLVFLWFNAMLVLPLPIIQSFLETDSNNYFSLFTEHMKIFGALAPLSLIITIIVTCLISKEFQYSKNLKVIDNVLSLKAYALLLSIFLFLFGGVLALFIDSSNVKIPAHYHGSIVGITIAFMSYIYLDINNSCGKINFKHAIYQLILYSGGQFLHISSLAYAGGYGALRKTPGVDLPLNVKVAMGFMGAGGLIAILAGLSFVCICYRGMHGRSNVKNKV